MGVEGLVYRPYRGGRQKFWVKVKKPQPSRDGARAMTVDFV